MLMATPRRPGHHAGVTSPGRVITPARLWRWAGDLVRSGRHHPAPLNRPCLWENPVDTDSYPRESAYAPQTRANAGLLPILESYPRESAYAPT